MGEQGRLTGRAVIPALPVTLILCIGLLSGCATGGNDGNGVTTSRISSIPGPTTAAPSTGPTTTALPSSTTSSTPPTFASSIRAVTAEDLYASWRSGCPVDVESLRAIEVTHWGYDGLSRQGTLVVAADVADDMVEIMRTLFEVGFPIERVDPVDVFDGDDDASMAANNTSAFNCRAVTGGSSWSEHSYGVAIDINPLVNPYVSQDLVLPPGGTLFVDRTSDAPGMIKDGDVVVDTFAAYGWIWGGSWSSPKDYQHFSTTGR